MIKIKKVHELAALPSYANPGDAGADICSVEELILAPGEYKLVSTGISIAIPSNCVALVHPRSGLAAKHGVTVLNAPGTIDSGFRGEVKVILINHGTKAFKIRPGDRIAQLVFQEFVHAELAEVDSLENSARGAGGFGSSGGFHG